MEHRATLSSMPASFRPDGQISICACYVLRVSNGCTSPCGRGNWSPPSTSRRGISTCATTFGVATPAGEIYRPKKSCRHCGRRARYSSWSAQPPWHRQRYAVANAFRQATPRPRMGDPYSGVVPGVVGVPSSNFASHAMTVSRYRARPLYSTSAGWSDFSTRCMRRPHFGIVTSSFRLIR